MRRRADSVRQVRRLGGSSLAAVLGSEKAADLLGGPPLARIAGRGAAALDPEYFGFAPVQAANIALERARLRWPDVAAICIGVGQGLVVVLENVSR